MGRQVKMNDVRAVNFQLSGRDFKKAFEIASRRGMNMSEFFRAATTRYIEWLEGQLDISTTPVPDRISLADQFDLDAGDPFAGKLKPSDDPDSADARVRKLI